MSTTTATDPQGQPAPAGPLAGLRVIEFSGLGPVPFACMLLSDFGADVVTIVRPDEPPRPAQAFLYRGRTEVCLDLKDTTQRDCMLQLIRHADVLIEGYRPGVMERLGLGPEIAHGVNPRLVYARMTGWGQTGPLAQRAGHDINYISLVGALDPIGPEDGAPVPPLNLVGDYGGGSLYLLFGILSALHERQRSGQGQVVDAAIIDGTASLMGLALQQWQQGKFQFRRGANLLDGGKAFYGTYRTADGKYLSVGPLEPRLFQEFCATLELDASLWQAPHDPNRNEALKAALAARFATRTRHEWAVMLADRDVCCTPVLNLAEALEHPHNRERGVFAQQDGVWQPAPAPRLSRTPGQLRPVQPTRHTLADCIGAWSRRD